MAFADDPDADRHGVVTPAAGLLNLNHMLAACVAYLFGGNRDVVVEPGARIGVDLDADRQRWTVSDGDAVVVPQGERVEAR